MKGLKRYLIVSAVLLVGYLAAQYYKPRTTDWKPSYLKEDKVPFGTYILYHQLHDVFPRSEIKVARNPIYNTLKEYKPNNSNYLFVSSSIKMDQLDFKELMGYIKRGNNVFIASFSFGKHLSGALKLDVASSFSYSMKKREAINFTSPSLKAKQDYTFKKGIADQYFSKFDTSRATVLGRSASGNANFIRYGFGKGNIYLLPNPQLLTNYGLLDSAGAEYAAKALSYLPGTANLIWDENNTRGNIDNASVLRVIFKHDGLRWAYYLSLAGLIIFVLFEMKRRQRVIPVIEPLKNSSVDFVKVVGKVYYQQRNNTNIAAKKVNYFLEDIRSNYGLKTTLLDDELKQNLMAKTGVQEETIDELFAVMNNINAGQQADDSLLINLNKLIEKFYKQAQ